jgi:hypothetical protein
MDYFKNTYAYSASFGSTTAEVDPYAFSATQPVKIRAENQENVLLIYGHKNSLRVSHTLIAKSKTRLSNLNTKRKTQ